MYTHLCDSRGAQWVTYKIYVILFFMRVCGYASRTTWYVFMHA